MRSGTCNGSSEAEQARHTVRFRFKMSVTEVAGIDQWKPTGQMLQVHGYTLLTLKTP